MTAAAKKVLDEALALPDGERRRVVEALLDTMPLQIADEIESAQGVLRLCPHTSRSTPVMGLGRQVA